MIDNPELGYTPANLRAVRKKYNLTQQQVADITGTASYRTVVKWETATDSTAARADMPLKKWLMLLDHIQNLYKS
jgi:hypothetical protein